MRLPKIKIPPPTNPRPLVCCSSLAWWFEFVVHPILWAKHHLRYFTSNQCSTPWRLPYNKLDSRKPEKRTKDRLAPSGLQVRTENGQVRWSQPDRRTRSLVHLFPSPKSIYLSESRGDNQSSDCVQGITSPRVYERDSFLAVFEYGERSIK